MLNIILSCFKLLDAKEQVLSNLANFAYDPINYGYMRQLQIIDIFLDTLSENNPKLVRFAVGGICNLCLGKLIFNGTEKLHMVFNIITILYYSYIFFSDAINKIYILRNRGVELVSSLLSSQDEDIILSAISTLMFLITSESRNEITSTEIIKRMLELSNDTNIRIKNLAIIFLSDYCEASEVEKIKKLKDNN